MAAVDDATPSNGRTDVTSSRLAGGYAVLAVAFAAAVIFSVTAGGVMMETAPGRSGSEGRSGKAGCPSTVSVFGFTGYATIPWLR